MSISLVGIDIESGGLDGYIEIDGQRVHGAAYYPILEIWVLVATSDLQKADAFSVGIRQSQESLDKMDPWAKEQHEKSGLLEVLAGQLLVSALALVDGRLPPTLPLRGCLRSPPTA